MPYCMYFHKGFALHGSDDIPGYRASHGCIRMFTQDAKWLNEEFVSVNNERTNTLGTLVVVRPVLSSSTMANTTSAGQVSPAASKQKPYSEGSAPANRWVEPKRAFLPF